MNREIIMQALLDKLNAAPLVFDFTASVTHGSVALENVSDTSGLFQGLPITGDGIDEGTVLKTVDPPTLSIPARDTRANVQLRQGFKNRVTRRLVSWEECTEQPAGFLCDADENHPARPAAAAAKIELSAELYVYTRAGADPDSTPATAINRFIDAVESAIDPSPRAQGGMWGTLGLKGVVYCRIEGDLIKAAGDNGAQAVALVPIKILVAQGVATR